MASAFAKYNGIDLPKQFSYEPASPKLRYDVQDTGGAVVIHTASEIVAADSEIEWGCKAATRVEWKRFLTWFESAAATTASVDFIGYWGDKFKIRFLRFDKPRAYAAGLFDLAGSFRITSVDSWGTADD